MKAQAMKQTLRQSIIAARLKLAASEHIEFSRTISKYIMLLDVYKRAKVVLGYMSFGAEFSTTPWIQQAMQDGKQVLLPKVNTSSKQLDIYQVKDLQQDLQADAWDIPEPLPERCAKVEALADIDFILLPGVAFARDGSRLGYGGGFYDKLLERIACADGSSAGKPALVAAAFSMQLVGEIPQEPTDRKVEWLLTENEVIDCTTERIHSSD
jgi:5-formyltetrahydrofolate cyclo-ligase